MRSPPEALLKPARIFVRWSGRSLAMLMVLALIASTIFWARSPTQIEQITVEAGIWRCEVASFNGHCVVVSQFEGGLGFSTHFYSEPVRRAPGFSVAAFTGIHWVFFDGFGKYYDILGLKWPLAKLEGIDIPYLYIIVASLIYLSFWGWRLRTSRRKVKPGFCGRCGYNLFASTGRCPECGLPIPAPVAEKE